MEVDLKNEQIKCLEEGLEVPFKTDPINRSRLLKGSDDITDTLADADKISSYEAKRREKWSWLELDVFRARQRVVGNSLEW
jgi:3-isopropylmalate dehydratase small subunit